MWGQSPHLKGGLGAKPPSLGCFCAYIAGDIRQNVGPGGGRSSRSRPRHLRGYGGLAPGLGHVVQGGSGVLAPQFRPQRTRGVQGASPPPRFTRARRTRGGSGGFAPGLVC